MLCASSAANNAITLGSRLRFCDNGSFHRLSCVWRETFESKLKKVNAKDLVEKKYQAEIAETQAPPQFLYFE